jgi:hypothetical protein
MIYNDSHPRRPIHIPATLVNSIPTKPPTDRMLPANHSPSTFDFPPRTVILYVRCFSWIYLYISWCRLPRQISVLPGFGGLLVERGLLTRNRWCKCRNNLQWLWRVASWIPFVVSFALRTLIELVLLDWGPWFGLDIMRRRVKRFVKIRLIWVITWMEI